MRLVKRDPDTGYLDNWLWVPKHAVNVEGTKSALTFLFPDPRSQDMRVENLWRETAHHLLVPRQLWKPQNLPFRVVDLRPSSYSQAQITSRIKLDHLPVIVNGKETLQPTGNDVQQLSLEALLASNGGILQLSCGKGKTCVALELIARRKVPALIVLPDTQLMEQWSMEIKKMLSVSSVGRIQADVFEWRHPVVLTTYHTIGARALEMPEEVRRWFGTIVWDEGHHIPAPTFAASAEAFYGNRYSLTATPERDDGLHIISEFHVGPVLYKDLTQDLKPRVVFKWTGLELDESNPNVDVRAKNQEIHLGKLSGYFGKWPERTKIILDDVDEAVKNGRKVLVLSNSEGEIANLAALWTSGNWSGTNTPQLFTDIPVPTPADVGETLAPLEMTPVNKRIREEFLKTAKETLANQMLTPHQLATLNKQIADTELALARGAVGQKIATELLRRQRTYIKGLLPTLRTCGIMVHKVPPKVRKKFIDKMPVVFAIMKYGKEGLDSPALDTVLVSTPFSSKNGLQQVMGRPARTHAGKKSPLVVFYEDNIGLLIGMCKKLKKHLREWPHEEGGPFDYEHVGHPRLTRRIWNQVTGTAQNQTTSIFGP